MARYFVSLTNDQGELIGRWPIETDDKLLSDHYATHPDMDELFDITDFGQYVQDDIEATEMQKKGQ